MRRPLASCLWLFLAAPALAQDAAPPPVSRPPRPEIRRLSELPAHALAFDEQGALYFGSERTIHKLTPDGRTRPFVTLPQDKGDTPRIWSLRLGPDGQLYGAAHDRVIRITVTGEVSTVIEEDFPGPCGATDVDFDEQGNMYVAYANQLARYTPGREKATKTIVLDGAKSEPPLRWLVGVRIDRRRGDVYLSDVPNKRALIGRFTPEGTLKPARVLDLPEHPEYFAVAESGAVYVGFPDADGIMRVDEHPRHALNALGERLDFVATLSFGGRGFDSRALYAACRNGVFEISVAAIAQ